MGSIAFLKQDAVAEVGVLLVDHHCFAQHNWHSTAMGKNYLIRLGEDHLYHALIHKTGVHFFKYPLTMLEFNRDEYRTIFEQTEVTNPPMDFDLPDAPEVRIRLFRQECTDNLLDFDYRMHRAVKNFYYGFKDGWMIKLVFVENHVMGVGIDQRLLVR